MGPRCELPLAPPRGWAQLATGWNKVIAPMSTRAEWITDLGRFRALASAWDRLAEEDPTPFARHAWVSAWWGAFGIDGSLSACVLWSGEELVACLPLHRRGAWLHATANEHTPAFRPLASGSASRRELAGALLAERVPIEARAMPADEPEVRELLAAVQEGGARTILEPDYSSPVTEVAGSFDEYRASLKPRWRELERRGRKLAREHQVEQALVAPPRELEKELEEGLALEAAGWKGRAGTAVIADQHTTAFYREVARAFHAAGELRFSSLRVDGRLAGFDLALLHRGRYFLLKTAYDERLRSLAPGLVLRRGVIERCFELGLEAHEFLGADMEWKRLFSTGERRHAVWRAYPCGALHGLRYAYRRRVRPRLKAAYLQAPGLLRWPGATSSSGRSGKSRR